MRRRRVVLALSGVAGLLVLALIAGVTFSVAVVQRSFPDYDGTVAIPRLQAEAEIVRDENGIPQIYADTPEDLFRAQGYAHAQDRFWQMDFRRHVTSGRLSELFGESQVETDAFLRTMDWDGVASRELPLLAPDTRRYLQAYSDGVNAWLENNSGADLGAAYTILGLTGVNAEPEPWRPVHSLAWLKAMAWDLRSNMEDEIDRALLGAVLPVERVEQLYPGAVSDDATILSADEFTTSGSGIVDVAGAPLTDAAVAELGGSAADALRRTSAQVASVPSLLGRGEGIGSNSWVVDGRHTTSGAPLLANDPHLGATMPSVWYQAGLRCREVGPRCPFDVSGFTFAGLPGVVIGHNADVAWGFTNLAPDVSDLYLERVTGDHVLTPDGPERLLVRTETITVADADPVTITIRSTPNGPIVSDRSGEIADAGRAVAAQPDGCPECRDEEEVAVALRWTALEPRPTADAIFALNLASDWDSFRRAAALFSVPSQNLVYADTEGNIGYQAPGAIPVRRDSDGRWPVPGWTGEGDWVGYIPFDELPSALNPDDGVIVTANQAVVGPEYPYLLTHDWDHGQRAARIETRLAEAGPLDALDMGDVQDDTVHPAAELLLPVIAEISRQPGYYGDGQDLLATWDGRQDPDSAAAAYFNVLWSQLLERVFTDELGEDLAPSGGGRWVDVVRNLLADPEDPYWDDVETTQVESQRFVLVSAIRGARDELTRLQGKDPAGWSWGRLHALTLREEAFGTSGVGPIEWLYNRDGIELGGGTSTVLATGWHAAQGYQTLTVPSMRMVVDLADLDSSRWIDLTGVSGHPFHEHYGDQTELWRTGQTLPMRWSDAVIADAAEHRLTLVPADIQADPDP